MDALFALFGFLDVLIPPKDERGRRWHRIGLFVALGFGLLFAAVGAIIYIAR